jgi:phosphate acetyltransferase
MHRPLVLNRKPDLLARLMAVRKDLPRVRCAIVHPCDPNSIEGAHLAAKAGLIDPVLVGPRAKIEQALGAAGLAADAMTIVATEHSHAAAAKAVAMARAGEVAALMKGSLHTDELMEAAVAPEGLRSGRRMSHVFVLDVPAYDRLLFVTDAAINIAPDLAATRDIGQHVIDRAPALGVVAPLVAILSAAETVNPRIPSTVDAAALCKMADRGQITGGTLDGPLAFDNAVSIEAATQKGIVSKVAGRADILVVPDLEAGNILAKQLSYFAGADSAGIVMGARCPIALTSRADPVESRLASAALLGLVSLYRSETAPIIS